MIRNVDWLMYPFAVAGLLGAIVASVIPLPAAAQPALKNLVMHEAPRPVPAIDFTDDLGQARRLAEFNGKVVVLNIWPRGVFRAGTRCRPSTGCRPRWAEPSSRWCRSRSIAAASKP